MDNEEIFGSLKNSTVTEVIPNEYYGATLVFSNGVRIELSDFGEPQWSFRKECDSCDNIKCDCTSYVKCQCDED